MAGEDAELRIVLRAIGDELIRAMADTKAAVTSSIGEMTAGLKRLEGQSAQSHAAVAQHTQTVGSAFGTLRERVTVGLNGITANIRAFGEYAAVAFAVLEGKKLFGEVIDSSREFAFTVEDLARRLGISTQAASVWVVAARQFSVPIGTIENALRALVRTLNTNEAAFKNVGIATRDAHGNLLPLEEIFIRTTERLKDFKAGTDQQVVATQILKRAVGELSTLLRVDWRAALDEAKSATEAYGLSLSRDQIEAQRKFEEEIQRTKLALIGFATDLAPIIEPFLSGLLGLVRDITLGFAGWAGLTAEGALLNAYQNLDRARVSAAAATQHYGADSYLASLAVRNLAEAQERYNAALSTYQGAAVGETKLPGTTGTESAPPAVTKDAAAKAEKKAYEDLKATRDADLASAGTDLAQKLRIEQHYALEVLTLSGATRAQQLEAAKALSEATQRLSAEDRAIALGHLREELSERTKALDEEKKDLEAQLHQGAITAPQFLAAAQELADRRLAIERALYATEMEAAEGNRRELAAIEDKITAAEAAAARERQENERKAAAAMLAEEKENAKLLGELFGGFGQAFNTALESMVDGTRSRADVMRSIWQGLLKDALKIAEQIAATWAKQGIVNALGPPGTKTQATGANLNEQFAGAVGGFLGFGGGTPGAGAADPRVAKENQTQTQLTAAVQHGEQQRQQITLFSLTRQLATWIQTGLSKLVHWIAVELGITTATVTSAHVREAIAIEAAAVDATSAAAGAAATKSAATTEATSNAYAGAAGAANAVASIPYAGPILAVLNYATVLATLLGAVRGIASAEGGMEDTGSSALMTMLHPREMVLPASIAETVRRGTGSTSTATGGEVHHHHNSFTIHAVDAHSFEQLLRRKPHVIADIAARGVSARPARGRHP